VHRVRVSSGGLPDEAGGVSTPDPIFGCVIASGRLDKDGYAFHGKTRAHIHAWEQEHGAVPEGLVLDHACNNRACKAVHHLEPVTQSENLKRRRFSYRSRLQRCPRGHDLRLQGVVTPKGGRVCRQCNRDAAAGERS
jgi:hypothetical protein